MNKPTRSKTRLLQPIKPGFHGFKTQVIRANSPKSSHYMRIDVNIATTIRYYLMNSQVIRDYKTRFLRT